MIPKFFRLIVLASFSLSVVWAASASVSVAIRLVSDIINEDENAKELDEDIDPDENPGEPDIAQSLDSIPTMSTMSNFS